MFNIIYFKEFNLFNMLSYLYKFINQMPICNIGSYYKVTEDLDTLMFIERLDDLLG